MDKLPNYVLHIIISKLPNVDRITLVLVCSKWYHELSPNLTISPTLTNSRFKTILMYGANGIKQQLKSFKQSIIKAIHPVYFIRDDQDIINMKSGYTESNEQGASLSVILGYKSGLIKETLALQTRFLSWIIREAQTVDEVGNMLQSLTRLHTLDLSSHRSTRYNSARNIHVSLLPKTLERLTISNPVRIEFEEGYSLPPTLKRLELNNSFNEPLKGLLPPSLEYLDLGYKFNCEIEPGDLPAGLKYLYMSSEYRAIPQINQLPQGLKVLMFPESFSYFPVPGLPILTIPPSLVELGFISSLNMLPTSNTDNIKILRFDPTFKDNIKLERYPPNVEKLYFEYSFTHNLSANLLPHSVTDITLGELYNNNIDPIPPNLKTLRLTGSAFPVYVFLSSPTLPSTFTCLSLTNVKDPQEFQFDRVPEGAFTKFKYPETYLFPIVPPSWVSTLKVPYHLNQEVPLNNIKHVKKLTIKFKTMDALSLCTIDIQLRLLDDPNKEDSGRQDILYFSNKMVAVNGLINLNTNGNLDFTHHIYTQLSSNNNYLL